MKKYFLLFFLGISLMASAQTLTLVQQLQTVYASGVAWEEPGELTYDAKAKIIAVKSFRIPVSEDTQVKQQKMTVIFMLQKNTSVTDVNDSSFKRAYFEIPFNSKEKAASFVKHFRELAKEK